MTKVRSICLFLLFACSITATITAQSKDIPTTNDSSLSVNANKFFVRLPVENSEPNSEELMKSAILHFDAARYKICLKNLTKALEINKFEQITDILYFYRAVCRTKINDFSNAISDYNAAIAVNPAKSKYIYYRGLTYFKEGNYVKAREDFEKTIGIQGPDADLYLKLGFLKQHENKLDASISDFTKAIKLNPKLAEAYYYRGLIYLRVLLREKACEDLNKAIELGYKKAEIDYAKYCTNN